MEGEQDDGNTWARREIARTRQIQIGKSRPEYKRYCSLVPLECRDDSQPSTPDPRARISKRQFDRLLSEWRRRLHEFDGPPGALPILTADDDYDDDDDLSSSLEADGKQQQHGGVMQLCLADQLLPPGGAWMPPPNFGAHGTLGAPETPRRVSNLCLLQAETPPEKPLFTAPMPDVVIGSRCKERPQTPPAPTSPRPEAVRGITATPTTRTPHRGEHWAMETPSPERMYVRGQWTSQQHHCMDALLWPQQQVFAPALLPRLDETAEKSVTAPSPDASGIPSLQSPHFFMQNMMPPAGPLTSPFFSQDIAAALEANWALPYAQPEQPMWRIPSTSSSDQSAWPPDAGTWFAGSTASA
mmetsp:Transcript_64089/g.119144  ORF Transcript_64089/g.119144 Transcript_64089/m.119144 type:complete len:356 (-) Transcript_64089:296-1363(-)